MSARKHVFQRLLGGEVVRLDEEDGLPVREACARTLSLIPSLNTSKSVDQVRSVLSDIIGSEIDPSTVVFAPFHINFGRFTKIGKNVFINHACSFLDLGGITVEDDVMLGPRVCLTSESHPLEPENRRSMVCKPVLIKRNAWVGANATILPGVTVGENSVVGAGAVVSKDVPDNVVVAGVPAKIIRHITAEQPRDAQDTM